MSKYRVVFESTYKIVTIEESYIVYADNEDEVFENLSEGNYDEESKEILERGDRIFDKHISTKKIEEDE